MRPPLPCIGRDLQRVGLSGNALSGSEAVVAHLQAICEKNGGKYI